jgi:hypothetical protein
LIAEFDGSKISLLGAAEEVGGGEGYDTSKFFERVEKVFVRVLGSRKRCATRWRGLTS